MQVRDILSLGPASLRTDFAALVREVAYSCIRHGVMALPRGAPKGLLARPPAWAPESAVDGLPRAAPLSLRSRTRVPVGPDEVPLAGEPTSVPVQ